MTDQSRSWLVLHEFSHIFSRDRLASRCDTYDAAELTLLNQATLPPSPAYPGGLDFDVSGSPTQYSTYGAPGSASNTFGQEYYTEAVTGTIWDLGWQAVAGYTADAGGWYSRDVLNITGSNGVSLFTWIMFNVIGLTSCPV
jgi:hypothetical protein